MDNSYSIPQIKIIFLETSFIFSHSLCLMYTNSLIIKFYKYKRAELILY
jgi:hypothetical protein